MIDVSYNSVQTGLLNNAMEALSESLELIPNKEGNVKVSVICVDDKLHFFKLTDSPRMWRPKNMDLPCSMLPI